jgi:superoxide reductase
MAKVGKIYKCEECGNIVEVLNEGAGELVCCGKAMVELQEKEADSSVEKHVPFIKREGNKYIVKVGENQEHPMTSEHYIQWIELIADGYSYLKRLTPNDKPEAIFEIPEAKTVVAREYCNLHGLWRAEV